MNKRDFLAAGLTLGCGTSMARTQPAPLPVGARRLDRRPDVAAVPGQAAWQGYLGEHFDTKAGPLRLEAVSEVARNAQTEQFTLRFSSRQGLAQEGLYTLHHANGQRLAVYLEPAAHGRLAAHFSRLV